MDIISEDVPLAGPSMGSLPLGLICNATECKDSESFCNPKLSPSGALDQSLFLELGHFIRSAVPGSLIESDIFHIAEVGSAPSTCVTDRARLAIRSLVSSGSPTGATASSAPPPRRTDK